MAVFADKAYVDAGLNQILMKEQNTYIYTPVELTKGQSQSERQFNKAGDGLFSTAVPRARQPIESLLHWIKKSRPAKRRKGQGNKRFDGSYLQCISNSSITLYFLIQYSH
ncbi:MAG: hypothetical protein ACI8WW_002681 [Oceanospirillaceae bacterium]|jgi:hypothetical protein